MILSRNFFGAPPYVKLLIRRWHTRPCIRLLKEIMFMSALRSAEAYIKGDTCSTMYRFFKFGLDIILFTNHGPMSDRIQYVHIHHNTTIITKVHFLLNTTQ